LWLTAAGVFAISVATPLVFMISHPARYGRVFL